MSAHKSITTESSTDKYTTMSQSYPEVAPSNHGQYPEATPSSPLAPQVYIPPVQAQQYHYQNPMPGTYAPQPQRRNPWGLSPFAFGSLIAVITALIVGGAVGGGVAGAMSGNDDSSSSSGPTATVTVTTTGTATGTDAGTATSTSSLPLPTSVEDYAPLEAYYVASLVQPSCSSSSRITTERGDAFDLFCGMDMGNQLPDDTDSDLVVADFVGLLAYTIDDCVLACSNALRFVDTYGDTLSSCRGVTWNSEMAASNTSNAANCWLKNGTSSGRQCNNCISAKFVQ